MAEMHDELNRVIRYSRERLPVSAIHPELRYTRLGAVLREHATEPSDVGELAYQALTSDHSQPLELMPLHLLRDKLQENPEHPLNHVPPKFKWQTLPERLQLDQTLRQALASSTAGNKQAQLAEAKAKALAQHEWAADGSMFIDDSVRRLTDQKSKQWFSEGPQLSEIERADPEVAHNNMAHSNGYGHPAESYR